MYKKTLVALAGSLLLVACESSRLHDQGIKDVQQGRYEDGVQKLHQAVDRSPDNLTFKSDLLGRQEEAVQKLIAGADKARAAGDMASAEAGYRRVLTIEPGNDRAQHGVAAVAADQRHALMVKEAQGGLRSGDLDRADSLARNVLAEDPGFAPAVALRTQVDQARGPVTVTPRLHTRDNRPVTLQFRDAPTKMVFEVLSRQTGINFIFDKDIKSEGKTTIFVQDVPIEQAIDLVLGQNQLARQVLSENMVLIYPNTAAKQKDYQDQIVKTFYLNTAVPKDVESLLKTVLDIKTLVVNERANAITVRETPEVVRMAEKLVASVDISEPEVMLEVEVLEVTRSRMQQLGINYPSSVSLAAPTNLVLNDLNGGSGSSINGNTITVSPLAVTVDALKTTGNSNVLASPRIRARNKEKAKILIGSRVPTITTAVTATGAGTQPIANTQVQYLEVGLTLDVEPTIYANDDVAIKINMEVSSITNTVKVGQTLAYEIGTRNATTLLQLKDGETQILAGLIQDSDTKSASKIPGLGDIPIVGRLFGDTTTKKDKSEVVLSITPRIIRARNRPSSDTSEFWYGTESRSGMAPLATVPRQAGASAPAQPGQSGAGQPGANQAGAVPAIGVAIPAAPQAAPANVSSGGNDPGAGGGSSGAAPVLSIPGAQPTSSGGLSVPTSQRLAALSGVAEVASARPAVPDGPAPKLAASFNGPAEVKVGEEFSVSLELDSDQPIARARTQVRWDATAFQLLGGDPGAGVPTGSNAKVIGRPGGAQLDINSTDEPMAGGAELVVLKFKAVQARPNTAIAGQVSVLGSSGAIIGSSTPAPLTVTVGN